MYNGKSLTVKPFLLMRGSELPTMKWKPMYCKTMDAPGDEPILEDVDVEFVQSSCDIAMKYLKQGCVLYFVEGR